MPDQEDVAQQQKLLAAYRRSLAVSLEQLAQQGKAFASPGLLSNIMDFQDNIQRIKARLRKQGIEVEDFLIDETPPQQMLAQHTPTASFQVSKEIRKWGFGIGTVLVLVMIFSITNNILQQNHIAQQPTQIPIQPSLALTPLSTQLPIMISASTPSSVARSPIQPSSLPTDAVNSNQNLGERLIVNGSGILSPPVSRPASLVIAFNSNRDGGKPEIYAMQADGSSLTRLTDNSADDQNPVWSPDGTRLAFVTDRDGDNEIYIMNADGTGLRRLTNNPANDVVPSWSPDGARIAFDTNRDGNYEIYVMNADGTGLSRLTNNPAYDEHPSWSPDGTQIAFESSRDDGNGDIYLMNANGSGLTRLTHSPGGDWAPAWSPDGTQIAFMTNRDGNFEIYVMNADGSGQTNLTNNAADDVWPTWSPDNSKIVFETNRDGNAEIYVMNVNGTGLTNLTHHAADDKWPSWSHRKS